jgi:hypothetical protein
MLEIAKLGTNRIYAGAFLGEYGSGSLRVVYGKSNTLLNMASKAVSLANFLVNAINVEVVQISTYDISNYDYPVFVSNISYAFYRCEKLKRILNILEVSAVASAHLNSAFTNCTNLELVRLKGLKNNLNLSNSPHISYESVLYIVANSQTSASGEQIIITLHPDADARIWEEDENRGGDLSGMLANTHQHINIASA